MRNVAAVHSGGASRRSVLSHETWICRCDVRTIMPAGHFDGDASRYSGGRLSADPNVPGGTERRADMLEVELPGVADELKNTVHRLSTAGKSANVAPLS